MKKSNKELPRRGISTSNTCMIEEEVQIMLNQPKIGTLQGCRDRVMLEVLYSTGIRISELIHIKVSDIDFNQGLLHIDYPGKWKSCRRTVPIGKTVCEHIRQYLTKVRPCLIKSTDKGYLFLTLRGNKFKPSCITKMVRTCWCKSGLKKRITAYTFRNSCAIHMLLNGADILYIHKLLGQKNLFSGKGYERLSTKGLKEEHTKYHPQEQKTVDSVYQI